MSLYETNVSALSLVNPFYASSLAQAAAELPYEVFMDQENLESLNLVHTKTFQPLYSSKPQDVIHEQIQTYARFQEYPYLYFFGLGNGILLKHLLTNAKHQRIVVIEPDPCIVYVVLHLVDFSMELKSGRLVLLSSNQLNFPTIATLFSAFQTQRYAKVYDLHIMSSFYENYAELIQQSNRLFIESLHHTIQAVGNDAHDALIGMEQHFMNLPLMLSTPPLLDFFKKAMITKVAVLASTGPSLAKQLPLLKKIAPYVTIFAVDASFPVLTRYGIKPDVVVSMERIPLTGRFFKDTPKEAFEGVIFALSSLQHPEVVDNIKAGTMMMCMRPFGYMMATGAPQWGYAGIGMSAANKAYELIYHSHFKTCVLLGQDLAYGDDGMSHSSGHLFGANEVKQKESDSFVERYGGGGMVRTTTVWNWFRQFFEKDIAETKHRMETINATEGGARIAGAIELPFEEVVASRVEQTRPKIPISLKPMPEKELVKVKKTVAASLQRMEQYLHKQRVRIEALFLEVAKVCEVFEKGENVSLETLRHLEKEIHTFRKVTQEEFFQQIIWHVAQSMLLVQEMALAVIEVKVPQNEEEAYEKMCIWLQANRAWLFTLAGCIDAIQTAMKRKGEHYPRGHKEGKV
ncbi:MAG: hypothetical protein H6Q35_1523 [Proteobacteria bacterium]|nr:hypothetical protein [Pseudomonadota bacterium]